LFLISGAFANAQNQWTKQSTSFTTSNYFNKPKLKIADNRMAFIDGSWGLHFKPSALAPWSSFNGFTQVDDVILTPSRFYIMQGGAKYFVSGQNFTSINCPIGIDYWGNIGEDIYVVNNNASNNKTVYKYTYSTNSWASKYKLQNCQDISKINISDDRIYLIYRDTNSKRVTETSKDGGNTWVTTDLNNVCPDNILKSGSNYYALVSNNIFKSSNGINFSLFVENKTGNNMKDFAVVSDTLYASFGEALTQNGIMYYNSSTMNWVKFDQGIVYNNSDFRTIYWDSGTLWTMDINKFQGDALTTFWKRSVSTKVSVNDPLLEKTTNIYPNPTENILNIDYDDKASNPNNIEVFDNVGRLIFREFKNLNQLDLTRLNTGTYIAKFNYDNVFFTKRIIRQ
jgi:hypothetical protein